MINLILFGPPGSGKGTQCTGIAERYGLHTVSTGNILRNEIKLGTPHGILAKEHIDKGNLVPDEVIVEIIEDVLLAHPEAKGFLFDGFPRTVGQAKALDEMMERNGKGVDALLELSVPDEQLLERLIKRKEIERRSDDNIDTINNRLNVYHRQTKPIIHHYAGKGLHYHIDGVGAIEEVAERLRKVVDEL